MPVIWSTVGSEVGVRVRVPEAVMLPPLIVKVATVVAAFRGPPNRRAQIPSLVRIRLQVVYQ
jgi:hypothetical protein